MSPRIDIFVNDSLVYSLDIIGASVYEEPMPKETVLIINHNINRDGKNYFCFTLKNINLNTTGFMDKILRVQSILSNSNVSINIVNKENIVAKSNVIDTIEYEISIENNENLIEICKLCNYSEEV